MTNDELVTLAHTLAYETSASAIEHEAIRHTEDDWMDITNACEDVIGDPIRYLEARGLVERHSEHNNWVRIRDESEAT